MGWISAQSYVLEGILFVSILITLRRYFLTQHYRWYLFACLLFTTSLFFKEMLVVLPFWLVGALHFYHTYSVPKDKKRSFLSSLPVYIRQASGFFLVMCFYLFVRVFLFPITRETKTLTFEPTIASFVSRMASRVFDFVTYGVDVMGFSWLPEGTMLIKGVLGIAVIALFLYVLYYSVQKSLVLFLLVSIPFLSWPALLMHHKGRYLYVGLIVVMAMIAFLTSSYKGSIMSIRRVTAVFLGCFLCVNIIFMMRQTRYHEQEFSVSTKALFAFAKNLPTRDRPLCFLNLPLRLFGHSTAVGVWVLRQDYTQPIYQYDTPVCPDSKVIAQNPVFVTWDYEKKAFSVLSENHI
jgi:hypothetical protein